MSVTLPDHLQPVVEAAAKRRHQSVAQFIQTVLTAQATAVLSDPYLEERAKRAAGKGWQLLESVPPNRPDAGDGILGS